MNEPDRQAVVSYRIKRAKETFKEIKLHIDNKLWNTAVNRLYYACYYAVIALLIKYNIKAQTHSGVRQMFGLHFIKTGKIDKELGNFILIFLIKDKQETMMILWIILLKM